MHLLGSPVVESSQLHVLFVFSPARFAHGPLMTLNLFPRVFLESQVIVFSLKLERLAEALYMCRALTCPIVLWDRSDFRLNAIMWLRA